MLLCLTTIVLSFSALSSGLPAAIKQRGDVVLREATPEPGMAAMSESLNYVKPREADAKAELEPGSLTMVSESLDYVKPREAEAKATPEPEDIEMMSESLDYVKPREAEAEAKAEPEHMSAMSKSLDFIKAAS